MLLIVGAGSAVHETVVVRGEQGRGPVGEPVEVPHPPQRQMAVERPGEQVADHRRDLPGSAGRRDDDALQVLVDVQDAAVHPERPIEMERHLLELPGELRHTWNPPGVELAHSLEPEVRRVGRVEGHEATDLHGRHARLHREKGGVRRGKAFHRQLGFD